MANDQRGRAGAGNADGDTTVVYGGCCVAAKAKGGAGNRMRRWDGAGARGFKSWPAVPGRPWRVAARSGVRRRVAPRDGKLPPASGRRRASAGEWEARRGPGTAKRLLGQGKARGAAGRVRKRARREAAAC